MNLRKKNKTNWNEYTLRTLLYARICLIYYFKSSPDTSGLTMLHMAGLALYLAAAPYSLCCFGGKYAAWLTSFSNLEGQIPCGTKRFH